MVASREGVMPCTTTRMGPVGFAEAARDEKEMEKEVKKRGKEMRRGGNEEERKALVHFYNKLFHLNFKISIL